jgi:uncharacterized protein YPO0396
MERMARIAATLDDLQAGIEACSRHAKNLHAATAKCNSLVKAPILESMAEEATELLACAREQHAVIDDLRHAIEQIRTDRSGGQAIRPPPGADRFDPQR